MKLLTKLFLFFTPFTVLLVGNIIIFSKIQVHKIFMEEIKKRGETLIEKMASQIGNMEELKDESKLLPHLQELKKLTAGSYVFVLDQTGKVLAHTNVTERDKLYTDQVTQRMLRANIIQSVELGADDKPHLELAAPILKQQSFEDDFLLSAGNQSEKIRIGTLRLGLPIAETLTIETKIFLRQIILLTIAITFSSAGLILFTLIYVLRPAKRLIKGISNVSQGHYGINVPVLSKDELGKLTECFNQMSNSLASTTVSKEYVDSILHHMLDPLFVVRLDGTIGSTNSALKRLLDYSDDELIGWPIEKLFPSNTALFGAEGLQKLFSGQTMEDAELKFSRKDGSQIPIIFSVAPLKDKDDQITGLICVARDITERKKLESRMLQSEKLSAVGQLAAGVAHEINNPLGIILGFSQTIKNQIPPTDSARMGLEFIEKEALRCKDLVQNLLVFSRASQTEQHEEIDFNATIADALSLVNAQGRVKNVEIIKELDPDIPPVSANRNQLQQVVINLCNNAMDAMDDQGKIVVRTGRRCKDGVEWVAMEIRDTGSGIPENIQAKIFEPFFTTKEVGKGTGLGLSLIHEIVRKHHGTLDFNSEVGKGTMFTIYFPLKNSTQVEKAA